MKSERAMAFRSGRNDCNGPPGLVQSGASGSGNLQIQRPVGPYVVVGHNVPAERGRAPRRSLEGHLFDSDKGETMELKKTSLGITVGLLWSVSVLLATLWVAMLGGGDNLDLLRRFYIGYSVSIQSAIVGLTYSFVDGFSFGWLLAWLCNRFC